MAIPLLSVLATSGLTIALVAPPTTPPVFSRVHDKVRFLAPFLSTCMIYFCFIRMLSADGTFKGALSLVGDTGSMAFALLFVYMAVLGYSQKKTPVAVLITPTIALAVALFMSGSILHALIGNRAMYVQIAIITGYILVLTARFAAHATTNEEQRRRKKVEGLTEQWGLSAREAQVLHLMADDYSNTAIADALVISIETVRTHKKRIYAKVDVHKHEELMGRIRGRADERQ